MDKRIIFMGTPGFAVASLEALIKARLNIVAVVTATDKLGGRGRKKLIESDVKKCAVSHGIPVLQPKNLKALSFVDELRSYNADLQVVVAFRMLPEVVWNMPSLGTVNLHGSLLPAFRGAAPIHWAVINGSQKTGVTIFKLKHEIDTGNIIDQAEMKIGPNETTGDVHDRMMVLGADTLVASVNKILAGEAVYVAQDDSLVSKAPKLHHETCQIDWALNVQVVHNFIRGLSPFPSAWTKLDGLLLKVLKCRISTIRYDLEPAQIFIDGQQLFVGTGSGSLEILECQLSGKRKMDIATFLNGYTPSDAYFNQVTTA